ncbi:hypothetical protein BVRB_2g038920 [Beta vulgaris subsp. vulgaris]|nr:hypothetical protein BVRB_2g038920 [Beta vulgaris subsp. vulgaris]
MVMSQEGNEQNIDQEKARLHDEASATSCWCYPFYVVGRFIGRCLFVACFPLIRCFGWDECRHQHHQQHFF